MQYLLSWSSGVNSSSSTRYPIVIHSVGITTWSKHLDIFDGRRCRLRHLGQDFELEVADSGSGDGPAYRLGSFKAFLGQPEHARHERFAARRTTIS